MTEIVIAVVALLVGAVAGAIGASYAVRRGWYEVKRVDRWYEVKRVDK